VPKNTHAILAAEYQRVCEYIATKQEQGQKVWRYYLASSRYHQSQPDISNTPATVPSPFEKGPNRTPLVRILRAECLLQRDISERQKKAVQFTSDHCKTLRPLRVPGSKGRGQ
jgi:hypothetical protein